MTVGQDPKAVGRMIANADARRFDAPPSGRGAWIFPWLVGVGVFAFFFALATIATCLVGCAAPLDTAVRSLNGSQTALVVANVTLADLHRRARNAAVDEATSPDDARVRAGRVHERYGVAWDAYDGARAAWIVAAAATQAAIAAEAASNEPNLGRVTGALADLSLALEAFEAASRKLREGAKP